MFDWVWGFMDKFQGWVVALLPAWMGSGFSELNAAMGPTVRYFAYLGGLDAVIPTVIGAYIVRFLIRRIPFFG